MEYQNTLQAIQDMAIFYSMLIAIPFGMYAIKYLIDVIRAFKK